MSGWVLAVIVGLACLVILIAASMWRRYLSARESHVTEEELLVAVRRGDARRVGELLDFGFDVNLVDADENTLLHLAHYEGQEAVVGCLRERGADEHLRNRWGFCAAEMGQLAEVEGLLRQGADALINVGTWTDEWAGQRAIDQLREHPTELYFVALERVGYSDPAKRRVVFLAIKLDILGTEHVLARLLHRLNDRSMAEAYINSNSSALNKIAQDWAILHNHRIEWKRGHHSVKWGVW